MRINKFHSVCLP